MRLIDADELYETLEQIRMDYIDEESMGSDFVAQVIELVQDEYIAKAPTIDPERLRSQWIPVAKRLPPEEQYVLITQKERYPGQAKEGEFHPVVKACFSDNCWFMSDGEIYFYDEDVVYAWMPLPDPYEPDGV